MSRTVQISDEHHAALSHAAKENGTTIGRLLGIILDVTLLGIPTVIWKWKKIKRQENQK